MAEDNLKAFLAENAIKPAEAAYAASARFMDENRQPIEWKLRVMSSEECDTLLKQSKRKEFVPGNRDVKITTDNEKFITEMVIGCVVFPNLNDASLQDSYGAAGAADLVHKMLTPGEFTDLANMVQQVNGFEVGMKDKVKLAKN